MHIARMLVFALLVSCYRPTKEPKMYVRKRQWRFARPVNAAMVHWSLGDAQ